MALVKAQIPADAGNFTVISRGEPGAAALAEAVAALRRAGADLAECRFVLATGIRFYGDYEVRNDMILLNEAIFEKPARMMVAAFAGYGDVVGNDWAIHRLIDVTRERVS